MSRAKRKSAPKIITGDVEHVDVRDLIEHPDNPRRGDLDAVVSSIEHHGFWGALIVQRSTGHVLAGNHRLKAARRLGLERVPVQYVDCDVDQARAILLADNRTSDLGGYDDEQLVALLSQLQASVGLEGTGYDQDALDVLMASADFELDDVPELSPDEACIKLVVKVYEVDDKRHIIELIKAALDGYRVSVE